MKTRSLLSGAALAGAQGFAISFAVVGLLTRVLTLNVGEFNSGLALTALLYAAACGMGAWVMASETAWRGQAVLFGLAGFVGGGVGYLLTTFFLAPIIAANSNDTGAQAIYILQFALIGALLGLLIGVTARSWRKLVFLVALGALGFGIGFLVQSSITELLAEPLSDLVVRFGDSEVVHLIAASLLWGVSSAACGFLGGMALGFALEQ